jgi:hypothetical protein
MPRHCTPYRQRGTTWFRPCPDTHIPDLLPESTSCRDYGRVASYTGQRRGGVCPVPTGACQ